MDNYTPRAHTVEEVRDGFLFTIRRMAKEWARQPGLSDQQRCDGVAFSILNIFDGTECSFPAVDLVIATHEDDKQFCIDNGDNWYEPGMVINGGVGGMLHDDYYEVKHG